MITAEKSNNSRHDQNSNVGTSGNTLKSWYPGAYNLIFNGLLHFQIINILF